MSIPEPSPPSPSLETPEVSLKTLALQGTMWTLIGFGLNQGLRLGANVVLTRLLVPEIFGLMTLVSTFIAGLNLFSDIGIVPSIVQSKRGSDPRFLNTAWTLQAIRGLGLWIACLAIAWPVSHIYDNPSLLPLIPLVGLSTAISGFNSTSLATLSRNLAVARQLKVDLITYIVSLVVMLLWAWKEPSVFALVAGGVVSAVFKMIWSHRLLPDFKNKFAWDPTAIKDLLGFGRWIFVSTAMTFLANQCDRLILAKLFPLSTLGIYTIALTFASIPREIIGRVGAKVLFPVLSRKKELPREELQQFILGKRGPLLIVLTIGIAILISFGDWPIRLLYDERYLAATWMLPILALGLWPLLLSMTVGQILMARGNSQYHAWGTTLKFVYMIILLPLGCAYFGLGGAVVVVAFNDLPLYGAIHYGLWREGMMGILRQDLWATLFLMLLIGSICIGRSQLGFGLPISGFFSI